ncbi:hypothetical protein ACLOJK_022773, partial [Asimina triloba]
PWDDRISGPRLAARGVGRWILAVNGLIGSLARRCLKKMDRSCWPLLRAVAVGSEWVWTTAGLLDDLKIQLMGWTKSGVNRGSEWGLLGSDAAKPLESGGGRRCPVLHLLLADLKTRSVDLCCHGVEDKRKRAIDLPWVARYCSDCWRWPSDTGSGQGCSDLRLGAVVVVGSRLGLTKEETSGCCRG